MNNKLQHQLINWGASVFLFSCVSFVTLIGFIIYQDMRLDPPFINVEASATPVVPGGISDITFIYDRDVTPRVKVESRWMDCPDGTHWVIRTVNDDIDNVAFPPGNDQKIEISIRIPNNVTPGQICEYGSRIRYSRIVLHDIVNQVPPNMIPIQIVSSLDN